MKKFLFFLILVVIAGLLGWAFFTGQISLPSRGSTVSSVVAAPSPELLNIESADLVEEYRNETYKFSMRLPENFTATDIEGNTVVLQNARGEGIQIVVSPFDEDLTVLTKERVLMDVPDMQMSDVQSVEVGANHGGIAFKSDNPDFEGASREVWFVFRNNLYQISTYERFDRLLQTMFSTWKFF